MPYVQDEIQKRVPPQTAQLLPPQRKVFEHFAAKLSARWRSGCGLSDSVSSCHRAWLMTCWEPRRRRRPAESRRHRAKVQGAAGDGERESVEAARCWSWCGRRGKWRGRRRRSGCAAADAAGPSWSRLELPAGGYDRWEPGEDQLIADD